MPRLCARRGPELEQTREPRHPGDAGERIWAIPLPYPPSTARFSPLVEAMATGVLERLIHPLHTPENMVGQNRSLLGLLYSLWYHISQPVADALGFGSAASPPTDEDGQQSEAPTRRILRLPASLYSRLSIHAAGVHGGRAADSLFHRSIASSYIASFRMLQFARGIDARRGAEPSSASGLLISMQEPTTSAGAQRRRTQLYVSSAEQEIANVERESEGITCERLERPSPEAVLDALPGTSFLHVASHGVSDPLDPSASFLVFQCGAGGSGGGGGSGGSKTEGEQQLVEEERLMVQRIKDDARGADGATLLDENLSVGYAFQASGFANIVGTLWPAAEDVCAVFAAYFYKMLAKHTVQAGRLLTSDWIAVAVLHATISILISEDILDEPTLWACFVHIGP